MSEASGFEYIAWLAMALAEDCPIGILFFFRLSFGIFFRISVSGVEAGRKEGRKAGRKEGRKEGRNEGKEERKEGRKKGMKGSKEARK